MWLTTTASHERSSWFNRLGKMGPIAVRERQRPLNRLNFPAARLRAQQRGRKHANERCEKTVKRGAEVRVLRRTHQRI